MATSSNIFYGGMDLVAGLMLLGVLGSFVEIGRLVALFLVAKGTLEIFPA
jgi:hypothetical protein